MVVDRSKDTCDEPHLIYTTFTLSLYANATPTLLRALSVFLSPLKGCYRVMVARSRYGPVSKLQKEKAPGPHRRATFVECMIVGRRGR